MRKASGVLAGGRHCGYANCTSNPGSPKLQPHKDPWQMNGFPAQSPPPAADRRELEPGEGPHNPDVTTACGELAWYLTSQHPK